MGGATLCFFAFRDRVRRPSEHEVAVSILRRAVSFAHGERMEPCRPHIRAGLPAFDAFIEALGQEGDCFERDGGSMPWDEVGDWLYAMEGLVGPGLRRAASDFLGRCTTGFGGFSAPQERSLRTGAGHYEEATREMDAFTALVASVGPIEEYEDRMQTGRAALASPEFRREAAQVIGRVRAAEEKAIEVVEAALAAELGAS
jgi:hypothetical protein